MALFEESSFSPGYIDHEPTGNVNGVSFACDHCNPGFYGTHAYFCSEEDDIDNVTVVDADRKSVV